MFFYLQDYRPGAFILFRYATTSSQIMMSNSIVSKLLIIIVSLLGASGCGGDSSSSIDQQGADSVAKDRTENYDDSDDVIMVKDDDPEMNAAIEESRRTVDKFISALESPTSSQTSLTVKVAVDDGAETEHFWLSAVKFKSDTFTGDINNDPVLVKNVVFGQSVSVKKDEISDWMFVDDGLLIGGYSVRLLRNRMPANQRRAFDKSCGFRIE